VYLALFHPKSNNMHLSRTFFDRSMDLDLIGIVILLGACLMLLAALGGATRGFFWSSPRVIGLLCGFGFTTILFITWQWWKQDGAILPPGIMTYRTVTASCVAAFFTFGALTVHTFFFPLWFQTVRGVDATGTGVRMIPYFLANSILILISGIFTSVVGFYSPPAILGSVIATVGCGVMTLLTPKTSTGHWLGFGILTGAGFGMSLQQGLTAVQAGLDQEDIATGTAAVVASQSLGGAIFLSVANVLFQDKLHKLSRTVSIPDMQLILGLNGVPTGLRDNLKGEVFAPFLNAYNAAIQQTFILTIPLAGLATLACCLMEWRSIRVPRRRSSVSG
jgi:hypothetical protein